MTTPGNILHALELAEIGTPSARAKLLAFSPEVLCACAPNLSGNKEQLVEKLIRHTQSVTSFSAPKRAPNNSPA